MLLRIFVLSLVASCASLFAQQTTATLTGTISDPSGAQLPGANVKATSKTTNQSRESVTDASGNYTIPFLTAGEYTVSATATGFQGQSVTSVTLQVSQTLRQDFQLKVGDVTE